MTQPSVNPSGRVQVISAPIASPGQCGICGKSSHPKGFVAPDLDFEFYGTLIFCYDCIGDMASVMGFFGPAELDDLRHQVSDQNTELNTLRKAILGLESAVDGLTNYRDATGVPVGNRGSAAVRPPLSSPTPKPTTPQHNSTVTDSTTGGVVGVGESTEPQPSESVSVAGPDDVYDTDSVNELLGLDTDSQP